MLKFPNYNEIGGVSGSDDVSFYRKEGTSLLERWYTSAITNFTSTTVSGGASNSLKSIPFIVSKEITLDRIGIEVTIIGSVGSVLRLGIYKAGDNVLPETLELDTPVDKTSGTGEIALDSLGFQSVEINKTLTPGLYWLCWVHNSAISPTFRAMTSTAVPSVLGVPATLGTGTYAASLTSTLSYGALPSTFDTTALTAVVSNPAIVSVRLST